ncbi:uncharacterized protein LOC9648069 [Selaginella moellendorffii]|uniref:uncharacterized protein LOC9648069 n=1 Tax=Selaginella moellendorffii TaxID=88036 RepID=UPI000D1CD919|nr:uncharacterized protein LOC9648069 [Selaginella moellendorffii]|eukprot:XP_024541209.1 uncharacterized protein LOC9648069 [Selaginella moellendorffii]
MDRFVSAQVRRNEAVMIHVFRLQAPCLSVGGPPSQAGVTGSATALSKVLGLVRELVLAAVFGVGPVVDAFGYASSSWCSSLSSKVCRYASLVPGFFLIILGGINGPIHITMVSALRYL